jgi:hypothetical protein
MVPIALTNPVSFCNSQHFLIKVQDIQYAPHNYIRILKISCLRKDITSHPGLAQK